MSPADLPLVDLPAFLRASRGERQPTVVVLGPPMCGKSNFARALAANNGWRYLDVLTTLSDREDIVKKIDQLDVSTLRQHILDHLENSEVILVDELDFLIPIWGDTKPFKEMVRTLTDPTHSVVFAFFLQTSHDWDDWNLLTASHQSRIFTFESIKPL